MMFSPSKYYRKRMEEHDAIFKQIAEHIIDPKCYTTKTKNNSKTNTNITNININITK
jgi:hypothetical protein